MKPVIAVICNTSYAGAAGSQPRDFANRAYSEALRQAAGVPVLAPLGCDEQAIRGAIAVASGLLITGGVDIFPGVYGEETLPCCGTIDETRDSVDRWAIEAAQELGLPVLAICRGIQSLGAFLGGTLYQDIPTQIDEAIAHRQGAARNVATHAIRIEAGSLLAGVVGAENLDVNTFHHQAVKDVPPGFRVSAQATDGVIEAIEAEDGRFWLGVQWHPEDMAPGAPAHRALFDALIGAAHQRAAESR